MIFENAYGITDISMSNGKLAMYRDSIKVADLEDMMLHINYVDFYKKYSNVRDENGAENMEFPSIIYAFYTLLFTRGVIPFPEDLIDEYYFIYRKHFVVSEDGTRITFNGKTLPKINLDARIARSYASLIRDVHFNSMLCESDKFDRVYYSCRNDIAGKDSCVTHGGKQYVISLFVMTKRSMQFKAAKNDHRHTYGNNEIQIPLDMSCARKIGDFYVYSKSDVDKVADFITKDQNKKGN